MYVVVAVLPTYTHLKKKFFFDFGRLPYGRKKIASKRLVRYRSGNNLI